MKDIEKVNLCLDYKLGSLKHTIIVHKITYNGTNKKLLKDFIWIKHIF